jgi:cytochrome c556
MRISLKGVILGIVLATIGGLAFAGFDTPEDAIRYRTAVMTVIGEHFGRLAAVVTGKTPFNENAVNHDTVVLRTMAELPWDACMVPGSEKGKTTLKAKAMKEKDKFMAIAKEFEQASKKLAETAGSGDLKAIREQFGDIANNCKSCHTTFRNL